MYIRFYNVWPRCQRDKTFIHYRYDIQHNVTQHNDTQHYDTELKGFICDTQQKRHSALQKCHYADCLYAECQDFLIVMLNVTMLSVVMLNVVEPIHRHRNYIRQKIPVFVPSKPLQPSLTFEG